MGTKIKLLKTIGLDKVRKSCFTIYKIRQKNLLIKLFEDIKKKRDEEIARKIKKEKE